tara:strand:+ start:64 stop:174 length:111 start_codon:yes stop_codon:yes gene_type:complete
VKLIEKIKDLYYDWKLNRQIKKKLKKTKKTDPYIYK